MRRCVCVTKRDKKTAVLQDVSKEERGKKKDKATCTFLLKFHISFVYLISKKPKFNQLSTFAVFTPLSVLNNFFFLYYPVIHKAVIPCNPSSFYTAVLFIHTKKKKKKHVILEKGLIKIRAMKIIDCLLLLLFSVIVIVLLALNLSVSHKLQQSFF